MGASGAPLARSLVLLALKKAGICCAGISSNAPNENQAGNNAPSNSQRAPAGVVILLSFTRRDCMPLCRFAGRRRLLQDFVSAPGTRRTGDGWNPPHTARIEAMRCMCSGYCGRIAPGERLARHSGIKISEASTIMTAHAMPMAAMGTESTS